MRRTTDDDETIRKRSGWLIPLGVFLVTFILSALFLLSLFFSPLVAAVSGGVALPGGLLLHPVTAPALILGPSRSSTRRSIRQPNRRAINVLSRKVRALPKCKAPVGEGARRVVAG